MTVPRNIKEEIRTPIFVDKNFVTPTLKIESQNKKYYQKSMQLTPHATHVIDF